MELKDINYYVLAYCLGVVIVTMYTLNVLYRSGRLAASVTVFILFLLIFVFFGLRWFKYPPGGVYGTPKQWPPVINTCPDYLNLITIGNSPVCVDTIGVATANGLKRYQPGSTDANDKFTELYNPTNNTKKRLDDLKAAAISKGLTWEGITDDAYLTWTK